MISKSAHSNIIPRFSPVTSDWYIAFGKDTVFLIVLILSSVKPGSLCLPS